jgi:hypothetical protein
VVAKLLVETTGTDADWRSGSSTSIPTTPHPSRCPATSPMVSADIFRGRDRESCEVVLRE